jgi:predicted  nucleic acid-binding Zn-ribbon protein
VSIRDLIAPLEELASIDADIRRIDAELTKHRGGLDALRGDLRALDDRLKADRDMVATMEKTRNELMTELRPMASQSVRARSCSGRATSASRTRPSASSRSCASCRVTARTRSSG